MSQKLSQKVQPKKAFDFPRVLGVLLTLVGGVVAIGVAIWVTGNASYLWALILLLWGVERVSRSNAHYAWKPAVLGLIMCLLYVGLAAVIFYVKDGAYLWAMILVHWIADAIMVRASG